MTHGVASVLAIVLTLLCSAQPARAQFPGSTFIAAGGPVTVTFESAAVSAPIGGGITAAQTYFLYRLDAATIPVQLLASYLPAGGPGLVIEGAIPGTFTVPLGSFAAGTALHFGVYSALYNFWQYTARILPPVGLSVRYDARDPITDAAGSFDIRLTGIATTVGVVPEPQVAALMLVGLAAASLARSRRRRGAARR